jgi:hypothetical protein
MDAILFSVNGSQVNVGDAVRHLEDHETLYWEAPFKIRAKKFSFPMYGFIHVKDEKIKYKVEIIDIIPHSPANYEDHELKPASWRSAWTNNLNNVRAHDWKFTLVIRKMEQTEIETLSLTKLDGTPVKRAPQSYTRIAAPT